MYILFGLLTYRDFKGGEGHPFFNIVLSYLWPLIAFLTPFGLLFYAIYKWINRKNHKTWFKETQKSLASGRN